MLIWNRCCVYPLDMVPQWCNVLDCANGMSFEFVLSLSILGLSGLFESLVASSLASF